MTDCGRFPRSSLKQSIQVCEPWNALNIGTEQDIAEPAIRSIAREDTVEVSPHGSFSEGADYPQTEFRNSPFIFR